MPLIFSVLNDNSTGINRGEISDIPVSLLDIFPTLASLADAPLPANIKGNDLTALLKGTLNQAEKADFRCRPILSEVHVGWTGACRMIRQGDYKLVYYHDFHETFQLFNVANDPDEIDDLGEKTEYADIKMKLSAELFKDWNPADVDNDFRTKKADLDFISRWGREVGMGPLDAWNC